MTPDSGPDEHAAPPMVEARDRLESESAQALEIDIWREASIERYDSGDEQYLATHPTREGFMEWLEAQCLAKRERLTAVRAGAALEAKDVDDRKAGAALAKREAAAEAATAGAASLRELREAARMGYNGLLVRWRALDRRNPLVSDPVQASMWRDVVKLEEALDAVKHAAAELVASVAKVGDGHTLRLTSGIAKALKPHESIARSTLNYEEGFTAAFVVGPPELCARARLQAKLQLFVLTPIVNQLTEHERLRTGFIDRERLSHDVKAARSQLASLHSKVGRTRDATRNAALREKASAVQGIVSTKGVKLGELDLWLLEEMEAIVAARAQIVAPLWKAVRHIHAEYYVEVARALDGAAALGDERPEPPPSAEPAAAPAPALSQSQEDEGVAVGETAGEDDEWSSVETERAVATAEGGDDDGWDDDAAEL